MKTNKDQCKICKKIFTKNYIRVRYVKFGYFYAPLEFYDCEKLFICYAFMKFKNGIRAKVKIG